MYPLIERFLSSKVTDIEFYFTCELPIRNLIVIPICVTLCISIYSHEQIELMLIFLNGNIQITTLKIRLKLQKAIINLNM